MYLKSLTVKGFKSFASATTLNFEPGITCVVGPNGSGKSNVVDALSWVMGEQGVKSLRGGKMEDVIFAGTSGRAPLGRAEVTLTIDNSDGALPIDYSEVKISRTMFRNGGSDYEINGNKARLLDVQELLSDSGIGREMHVIVGQGQLDTILQATPEIRRGFIEEAAGVLKHRKRKEKALRKLESTETNVNRLTDLVAEVRRQLKPLGRQAEVARRAAVIQADARDARSRLLADDLVQATLSLRNDLADEAQLKARREELEAKLESGRSAELAAEETVRQQVPRLNAAQDVWYSLAALRERVASTISIAAERVRNAQNDSSEERRGRDPEQLEAEAEEVQGQEDTLAAEVELKAEALETATDRRHLAEDAHAAEEQRLAGMLRAAADRREGLARLGGQVNSMRSRADASADEIGRLSATLEQAATRAGTAAREFTTLETRVASLDDGESDLDSEHEIASERLDQLETELAELRTQEAAANSERGALAARLEALQLGLNRKDGAAALLAADTIFTGTDGVNDLLGTVAALVSVEPGYETAVASAFGAAADAVAVTGLDAAVTAFDHLRAEDLGRAGMLLAGGPDGDGPADWPTLPSGARYAAEAVSCRDDLRPAVNRALRKVAVTDDLDAAKDLIRRIPDVTAVTKDADLLSAHFAAGGSSAQPSLIEVQAAVDEAEQKLAEVTHTCDRLKFAQAELTEQHADAQQQVEYALARLHESDAQMAALAEELGQLNSAARSSRDESDRLQKSIAEAEQVREETEAKLEELELRLEAASADETEEEPDPATRDRLAEEARLSRAAEMEARLGLRTVEERVRALSGRADALRKAADNERAARARAQARRERMIREAKVAAAVQIAATYLAERVEESITLAAAERAEADAFRSEAEESLTAARRAVRELGGELESLVDTVHRDELARAERRMRIETLAEKAMTELGIEAETLMKDFGPEIGVPVLIDAEGNALDLENMAESERPEPVPYVRDDQAKRLRKAERALTQLGKINPLALEEFSAMEERHAFLAEQAEDLRKTREDLLSIIADVDARVEQVFAEAYADVEKAFNRVFARLFPGGEGALVLTEPGNWLTTGVDVKARPAGKKVSRLSLLSGGERSLVAVAFLVSLFIARPSPFYILDEVEAALDDTNLGRLLEIYEELRQNSQLLVITHHKRTMEVADALYGVTMRGDGVSAVISQRLREAQESVA